MAITRRQFVTRLGALAAAAGFSQAQASQIMEAVAYDSASHPGDIYQGTFSKPRVVWLHGAECTGCSTSLLSAYENLNGIAIEGTTTKTVDALTLAGTLPINNPLVSDLSTNTTLGAAGLSPDPTGAVNIADILIDVIDLIYHETVMSMGGDLAYQWLQDFKVTNNKPFVLVVEGALQDTASGGAWGDVSTVPWCSVAHDDNPGGGEVVPAEMVQTLGELPMCAAIIAIGQCAAFGGYPGCKPPMSTADAGFNTTRSQTDALGVFDYLQGASSHAASKVVNTPGCPTNPWWFVLTVVCFLVDAKAVLNGAVKGPLGILGTGSGAGPTQHLFTIVGGVDGTRRLKAVYSSAVHSALCSKFRYYATGVFAQHPGDKGCLMQLGCKGPAARSLCSTHGWNNQQPTNIGLSTLGDKVAKANTAVGGAGPYEGGNCTRAGHPCMACTEKGYPDAFVPFVVRS